MDKGAPLYIKLIVVVAIIAICFFSIKKKQKNKQVLEQRRRYGIAVTHGYSSSHRSSKYGLNYLFSVNGVEYRGYENFSTLAGVNTNGGEYIVKFDPLDPHNCELLLDKPVVFHPSFLEDSGWIIVPGYILGKKQDTLVW